MSIIYPQAAIPWQMHRSIVIFQAILSFVMVQVSRLKYLLDTEHISYKFSTSSLIRGNHTSSCFIFTMPQCAMSKTCCCRKVGITNWEFRMRTVPSVVETTVKSFFIPTNVFAPVWENGSYHLLEVNFAITSCNTTSCTVSTAISCLIIMAFGTAWWTKKFKYSLECLNVPAEDVGYLESAGLSAPGLKTTLKSYGCSFNR